MYEIQLSNMKPLVNTGLFTPLTRTAVLIIDIACNITAIYINNTLILFTGSFCKGWYGTCTCKGSIIL